jgi:Bacterial SH3 domain
LNRPKVSKTHLILFFFLVSGLFSIIPEDGIVFAQQGTSSEPTVTGTPSGVMATVRLDQQEIPNVRSGPGRFYPKIGVLMPGQQVPVKGKSSGGDWILIVYPGVPGGEGWVYSPYVQLTPGEIPVIEPPPTPTPLVTQTIDTTLAAQFIVTPIPTRMDTFTPAPPVVIPTYVDESANFSPGGIPAGLVILVIAGLGITIGIWAVLQGR